MIVASFLNSGMWTVNDKSVSAAGILVHHGDRRDQERWVRTDCNVELVA